MALQDPAGHCSSAAVATTHFCTILREYAAAVLAAEQLGEPLRAPAWKGRRLGLELRLQIASLLPPACCWCGVVQRSERVCVVRVRRRVQVYLAVL